ncbi:MAG: histidinol dehydrogenase [Actinomycetota bacterium]|nr:histidinol dehydrogenase [Actinomycetota bacterium]
MLTFVDLRGYSGDPLARVPRARQSFDEARLSVREVIGDVRRDGDAAVRALTHRFDGATIDSLRIEPDEIDEAAAACNLQLRAGIERAAERIRAYHERQLAEERAPWWRLGQDGAWVGEETRALRRVGCYVPGGRAAYPSTVLMTTIPARVAGVEEIAVCVPPGPDGRPHPATLTALSIAGVGEAYRIGGAQAIAALAYGTETISRVDKIVGPGSIWVTLAKHEVSMDVGVDGFAGPTEIVIVADDGADPRFVAADLVAQAEHDPLALCVLVTSSQSLIDAVQKEIVREAAGALRRDTVDRALSGQGYALLADDLDHALAIADAFAPEHLELVIDDPEAALARVRNAGAVFCGGLSPVALGDYVAGTNHVLPTAGTGRFASPLRVSDFVKTTAVINFGKSGIEDLAPALTAIAAEEGLAAHARAIEVRLS